MKRPTLFAVLALGASLFVVMASAQRAKNVLTIEQVMTPSELRATGVATLTRTQRGALDKWLSEYTLRVLKVAQSSCGGGLTQELEH